MLNVDICEKFQKVVTKKGKICFYFATLLLIFWVKIVLRALELQNLSKDSNLKDPGESYRLFSVTIMNKIDEANFRLQMK